MKANIIYQYLDGVKDEATLTAAKKAFNEQWAVIRVAGKVGYLQLATGIIYDERNFVIATRPYKIRWAGKDQSFAVLWAEWRDRKEYAGIGFYPDNIVPDGYYNLWRGFKVKPREGKWDKLEHHILVNLCRGEQAHYTWLLDWIADIFQNPTKKKDTHVVLRGKEGVGKTKICEIISHLLGTDAAMLLQSKADLLGHFNDHLERLLFAQVSEAFWAGDKESEGTLKSFADARNVPYRTKFLSQRTGKNYTRLMFSSNEEWVVPAWSGGRRWFVLDVGDAHEQDHAYFAAIDEQMDAGGFEAFLHALLTRRITSNLRAAPQTEALLEQRIASFDRNTAWLYEVMCSGQIIWHDTHGNRCELDLKESSPTEIRTNDLFASMLADHRGTKRPPMPNNLIRWLNKELGDVFKKTIRPRGAGVRPRYYEFPALVEGQDG
jgi:hypothetical protein